VILEAPLPGGVGWRSESGRGRQRNPRPSGYLSTPELLPPGAWGKPGSSTKADRPSRAKTVQRPGLLGLEDRSSWPSHLPAREGEYGDRHSPG
jgi:hypothetical protein